MALRPIRLSSVLALLVLAGTVPLAIFAGLLIRSSSDEQRRLIEQRNVETARAMTVAVDQYLHVTMAALETVTALSIFEDNVPIGFRDIARNVLPLREDWRAVLVTDPAGRVVVSTDDQHAGSLADADGWVAAVVRTRRPAVSNLIRGAEARGYTYIVAVPVIRQDAVRFVLAAEIDATSLSGILRRQEPVGHGVVGIVDRRLTLMARSRSDVSYVGRQGSPAFAEASRGRDEGSLQSITLEGVRAYSSFSRSPLTGWIVGVAIPAEEVDAPMQASFRALTAAGIAILLIGGAIATWVGQSIVRANRALLESARALARGEAIQPVKSPIAEIVGLSRGIEQAGATLAERSAERDEAERQRSRTSLALEQSLVAERDGRLTFQAHEVRLDVTLRSIGDAVIATDPHGRITIVNAVAQTMTGWTEGEALGRHLDEVVLLVDSRTRERLPSPIVQSLRAQGSVARDPLLLSKDGREIPVEDSTAPIKMIDGTQLGSVLVFRNVSERRDAERRRLIALEREQYARQQAEALSRSKDDFVATVSHELRTPLNAIFGWVRLLRSGAGGEVDLARALEVIERNTRAQTQLVEDLLDMSRIIAGRLRPELRRVDVGHVVGVAIDSVRPTAQSKGITIHAELETTDAVAADPDRLQQIVWNLLVNAIKFTGKGGAVTVALAQQGTDVVLRIKDNGVGVAPEMLPYVFDRFWQGTPAESRSHGGLGIGLSLVRRLVDLHGGSVAADSEGIGCGATFTVKIPALGDRADIPSIPEHRYDLAADQTSSTQILRGVKAVVVDDDEDSRELVSTTLRHAGAETMMASSMAEALRVLDRYRPDVVLSDIAMPDGTGYDLARQIRGRPGMDKTPIVAFTAYSRIEDREQAFGAGFDFYIGKPVEPMVLVRTVAAAAGRT